MRGHDLRIATMQGADVGRTMAWAAAEGWNPGVDDGPCFVGTDPDGFLAGFLNGEPVGCISVVRNALFEEGRCRLRSLSAQAKPARI